MKKISKIKQISAGIVPVKIIDGKYKFLLLRSYDNWDFPKGGMDKDEDILETAIRETKEETTLTEDNLNFRWGNVHKKSDPYKKGKKTATYFVAESNKEEIELPISQELGRPEHDAYIWVEFSEAKKLVNKRVEKILDWANDIIKEG